MNDYLLKYNGWKYFFLLTFFAILITFAINFLFVSDGLYYQSFSERLTTERIAKMIEASQKWQWLGYVFLPVVILIRVCFTAICIYIGCFLSNIKVGFLQLFKVALLADFIFVLIALTKLLMLIFFKDVSTLEDLQFQPLSLLELFDRKSIDTLFIYPFSLISVFELLYWLVLARLL